MHVRALCTATSTPPPAPPASRGRLAIPWHEFPGQPPDADARPDEFHPDHRASAQFLSLTVGSATDGAALARAPGAMFALPPSGQGRHT